MTTTTTHTRTQTDRQRDRQTERQTDRQTERQTDRQTERRRGVRSPFVTRSIWRVSWALWSVRKNHANRRAHASSAEAERNVHVMTKRYENANQRRSIGVGSPVCSRSHKSLTVSNNTSPPPPSPTVPPSSLAHT